MRPFFFAVLSLPILVASASNGFSRSHRRRHGTIHVRNNLNYKLTDLYQGEDFLNEWSFFSAPDPTHGMVNYQTLEDAQAKGLAYVQEDGTTVLAVDDTTELPKGEFRNSVRIESKKQYGNGLFIADIWTMPHGCGTWPAWWTVGPDWPNGGEIDVIEGVHENTANQYAIHTSEGCSLADNLKSSFTANVFGTKCASSNGDNSGCGFNEVDNRTYGTGFNLIAGGVYVHEVASTGISIWYFPRDEIPADITAQQPNPSTWGTPSAFWSSDSCDIASHFYEHSLIFDTTLCGDWGEGAYASSGCPGTCADAVMDPTNFKFAKWKLNYVAVYTSE